MAEQLNEDKLIVKDNIVKKGAKDGWELIKTVWVFFGGVLLIIHCCLKQHEAVSFD